MMDTQLYRIDGFARERRCCAPNKSTVTWAQVRYHLTDNPMTQERAALELERIKQQGTMFDRFEIVAIPVLC